MISVKDFSVITWNGVWPFLSGPLTELVILQPLNVVEFHVDFWVKILIALVGALWGWRYLDKKGKREEQEALKVKAEARRIEIDNEERLIQNAIERKHYESVIRKMATEELIEQLAENVKNIDDDRGISDQLKKHGIRIDKFENK